MENRLNKGKKIDNLAAYTLKALKEDWRPRKSQFEVEKEKELILKKHKEQEKLEEQRKQALKQQAEREKINKIFIELPEQEQDKIMEEAFKLLEKENKVIYNYYQDGLRKGKELREMILVQSSVLEYRDDIIKERYRNNK